MLRREHDGRQLLPLGVRALALSVGGELQAREPLKRWAKQHDNLEAGLHTRQEVSQPHAVATKVARQASGQGEKENYL